MLIFLDIDGTLVMPGQPLGKATVAAIRAARAKGHKVFLSTGRSEASVQDNIRLIGFDGAIYSAGGRVVIGKEEIFNRPMPDTLLKRVLGELAGAGLFFTLECAHNSYRSERMPPMPEDMDTTGAGSELRRIWEQNTRQLKLLADRHSEAVYKVSFLATSMGQISELKAALGSDAKVVAFGNLLAGFPFIGAEVSDPLTSKGTALVSVCEYLHASQADCVAFGDSMNDAEILEAAGTGIAMGNAEPAVKAIAGRVCESCWNEGVAKELERMGLA